MKLPFLVMGFNRPRHLSQVLDSLPKSNVDTLFVSLDGPRNDLDAEKIGSIIKLIQSQRFPFKVFIKSQTHNLGCALGVVSAIDWFFMNVDEGIILEDDCITSPDFFNFVINQRNQVSEDSGVGMISAHNPFRKLNSQDSFQTRYSFIYGWYSKSKIWKIVRNELFRQEMPNLRNLKGDTRSLHESIFWWATATRARHGRHDTWDSPFADKMFKLGLKCIIPPVNFVRNIGFGDSATHTSNPNETIFIENDQAYLDLKQAEVDTCLSKHYFKISRKHLLTPWWHILIDFVLARRKLHEKILLEHHTLNTIIEIEPH